MKIILLASVFLQATLAFAVCPTVEFLGEFEATPLSCEDKPFYFLKTISGTYQNNQMQISFKETRDNSDVFLLSFDALSDSQANSEMKCTYDQNLKSVNFSIFPFGEMNLIKQENEYQSKFFGCVYRLTKK